MPCTLLVLIRKIQKPQIEQFGNLKIKLPSENVIPISQSLVYAFSDICIF